MRIWVAEATAISVTFCRLYSVIHFLPGGRLAYSACARRVKVHVGESCTRMDGAHSEEMAKLILQTLVPILEKQTRSHLGKRCDRVRYVPAL